MTKKIYTILRILVVVGLVVGGFSLTGQQRASAAETADGYCSQYPAGGQRNACKDGINGKDCADYAIVYGEATANICRKAADAKKSGQITDTPTFNDACADFSGDQLDACNGGKKNKQCNTNVASIDLDLYNACATGAGLEKLTSPPSGSSGTPESGGAAGGANNGGGLGGGSGGNTESFKLQDQLDQTQDLSEYIDVLHEAGPDSDVNLDEIPDDSFGFYINGAGKKQRITPIGTGTGSSPAIIFFNGGGWHMNDGTSQGVMDTGQPQARGYIGFDATYRYGSSGIYYMFEDVMLAIKHVRNNAGMYGVDPDKIAIWGDSAGGSLSMRVAGSGKSGAKAAVGWSAPTNAYTALFKSFFSFAIGLDHSTCIPTDLAGLTNTADLLAGGSGDVAEYGQGLSSNDFTSLGLSGDSGGGSADPLTMLTDVLTAAQYAVETSQSIESVSSQIESGGITSLSGGVMNLSAKKLNECVDNLNVMSPALFASPDSTPSFIAGFDNDGLIDPSQAYEMRDKLRTLGIRSDALIIPGDEASDSGGSEENRCTVGTTTGPGGGSHLGCDKRFICPSLKFIDEIIQPERGIIDCETGVAANAPPPDAGGGGAPAGSSGGDESSGSSGTGGGGGSNGSGSSSGSGSNSGGSQSGSQTTSPCDAEGYQIPGGPAGPCPKGSRPAPKPICDTWDSSCNGGTSMSGSPTSQKPQLSCPSGYSSSIDGTACLREVTGIKVP